MWLPRTAASRDPACQPPVVLHLAGTGDYSVTLQQLHAQRLAYLGVGSLLLVNPFYKPRRPASQKYSSLPHLSDLFLMGGSLILECWLLLRWLEDRGYSPLALHGVSLGGFMASLAASVYNRPLPLVPCLSWTSSSPCYVRGSLSDSLDWEVIRQQLAGDAAFRERIWPLIRDSGCPPRYRVPATFADPLQAAAKGDNGVDPNPAWLTDSIRSLGSLERLRSVYTSISDYGVGLFASGQRSRDDQTPTQDDIQMMNAMENKHRQQRHQPDTAEEKDVREFVTCLLDYFTHMGNFEPPVGPIYSLQALGDGYIPRDGVFPLTELWPDMHCRVVNGGHVNTIFMNLYFPTKPHDLRNIVLESMGLFDSALNKPRLRL
uniref:Protein ABHD18 n=2 Tax=Macrostomum lignano TaxID=282301 RepID=A0A1I8IET6_9PLAT